MESITITEALSEINLIKKKIASKREKILSNLVRAKHLPDPFETENGSEAMVKAETQSVKDLYVRLVKLRHAISKINLETLININGITMSIHDWLIWKREVYNDYKGLISQAHRNVKTHLDQTARNPQVFKDADNNNKLVDWQVNLDYSKWVNLEQELNDVFEKLDGQLSLKNAVTTISI